MLVGQRRCHPGELLRSEVVEDPRLNGEHDQQVALVRGACELDAERGE